jgi:hypothetical protein
LPAQESGSGSRNLHVAASVPIARDVTPEPPQRRHSRGSCPGFGIEFWQRSVPKSLHEQPVAAPSALCYGRRWMTKINLMGSRTPLTPRDSRGAVAPPGSPDSIHSFFLSFVPNHSSPGLPLRGPRVPGGSLPRTASLIYGAAIRIPRKALKT